MFTYLIYKYVLVKPSHFNSLIKLESSLLILAMVTTNFLALSPSIQANTKNKSHFKIQSGNELLELAAELVKVLKEGKESLEIIEQAKDNLERIKANETPKFEISNWDQLAEKFEKVAEEIKEAPLPTKFDSEKYGFDLNEFGNCETREESFKKVEGFLEELKAAEGRGEESQTTLSDALDEVQKKEEALDFIKKQYQEAIKYAGILRVFGQFPELDWVTIDQSVIKNLHKIRDALKEQQSALKEDLILVKQRRTNLEGNLSQLKSFSCDFAGHWVGSATRTQDGYVLFLDVLITERDENSIDGKAILDNMSGELTEIEIDDREIKLSIGEDESKVSFKGKMSENGTQIIGTFESSATSGTFTINRKWN